jgi:hypothetical protein
MYVVIFLVCKFVTQKADNAILLFQSVLKLTLFFLTDELSRKMARWQHTTTSPNANVSIVHSN